DAILLPGLVNAHTHLDLTGAAGRTPPRLPFPDWLRSVIAFRAQRGEEETRRDILDGARRCLASGTTLVGDIAAGGLSAQVLHDPAPAAMFFFELIGLSDIAAAAALKRWQHWHTGTLRPRWIGPMHRSFSPHAPYSFNAQQLGFFDDI